MTDAERFASADGRQDMDSNPSYINGYTLELRREPFEFGILPASYLLPNVDTPSALVPIQRRLLACASPVGGVPAVTKEDIARCLDISETTAAVVIDTLNSTLPTEQTDDESLNQEGDDASLNASVNVQDLLLFLFVQTFTRPRAQSQLRESVAPEFNFNNEGNDGNGSDDEYGAGTSFTFGSPSRSPMGRRNRFDKSNTPSSPGSPRLDTQTSSGSDDTSSLHALFVVHHFNVACGLVVEDAGKIGTGGTGGGLTELNANEVDRLGYIFRERTGRDDTSSDSDDSLPDIPKHTTPNAKLSVASGLFKGAQLLTSDATVPVTAIRDWVSNKLIGARGGSVDVSNLRKKSSMGNLYRPSLSPVRTTPTPSTSTSNAYSTYSSMNAMCVIEGLKKSTVVRRPKDFPSTSNIRVADCDDAVVYLLAPMSYVSIVDCRDCVVVVGAASRAVRVERCHRVTVIAASKRLRVRNVRDSMFHLAVQEKPMFIGDCSGCTVAPYNTFYESLERHLAIAKLEVKKCTMWNQVVELGGVGVTSTDEKEITENEKKSACELAPENFAPFIVPFRGESLDEQDTGSSGSNPTSLTRANPFFIDDAYVFALDLKVKAVASLRKSLRDADLSDERKRELQATIQSYFKDWLSSSGAMRQVYELARIERGDTR